MYATDSDLSNHNAMTNAFCMKLPFAAISQAELTQTLEYKEY